MEKTYGNAKLLVSMKYDERDMYYPLYVLAINTLFHYYNNPKIREIIVDTFLGTDIHIEPISINEILLKYDLQDKEYVENFKDEDYNMHYGMSSPGIGFGFNEEKAVLIKNRPYLVCNSLCGHTKLLNVFIHEMNHLIKSYINYYDSIDDKLIVRSGINYSIGYIDNEDFVLNDYHNTLDEVINTLETTELTSDILMIDGIVPDECIQRYIDSLKKKDLYKDFGYDFCTKIIKPLWKNNTFKSLIQDNIIEGDICKIVEDFNNIAGDNSFENLSVLLDKLNEIECINYKGNEKDIIIKQIRKIINTYNKKTKIVYEK